MNTAAGWSIPSRRSSIRSLTLPAPQNAGMPAPLLRIGPGPPDGVFDDLLNVGVLKTRVGFMPRLEVEDLPIPTNPGASAAEDFPAVEPAHEDRLLGLAVSKGSPYISSRSSTKVSGTPSAMGWLGFTVQSRSRASSRHFRLQVVPSSLRNILDERDRWEVYLSSSSCISPPYSEINTTLLHSRI